MFYLFLFTSLSAQELSNCIQQEQWEMCINKNVLGQKITECFLKNFGAAIEPEEELVVYAQFYLMVHIFCAQKILENKHTIQVQILVDINKQYDKLKEQLFKEQDVINQLENIIFNLQKNIIENVNQFQIDEETLNQLTQHKDEINLNILKEFQHLQQQITMYNKENLSLKL